MNLLIRSPSIEEVKELVEIIYQAEASWQNFAPEKWRQRDPDSLVNILLKNFISSRILVSDREGGGHQDYSFLDQNRRR